jgi:NAD(P)-dependent dehydrogenase (short-subunit alcohol dehydrogenase family)
VPFTIELEGRRALITGAGQGIGRGIAHALAQAGAVVVVNDFVPERAQAVVDEIRASGGAAEPAPFDVTDFDAVMAVVASVGPVDVLVNNAGNAGTDGFAFGAFADSQPADWDRYLDVNLYGVLHCTRAVLPGMIEGQYGRVITIISDAGRWGEPFMGAYAAAKAGAAGFSRAIAREVGRHGITVNNIALGTIDSSDPATRPPPTQEEAERRQKSLRAYIIRRPGHPDDVVGLVTLLASPLASWITGQTYPVNGGYTVNQ